MQNVDACKKTLMSGGKKLLPRRGENFYVNHTIRQNLDRMWAKCGQNVDACNKQRTENLRSKY